MDLPFPWASRIEKRIQHWLAAGVGARWIVAVSGGSDSVGLLRFLYASAAKLGLELVVAHLNHGARGAASEADARFVAQLAEKLELPFELGSWRPQRPGRFEVDARRARYEWLTQVALSRGASVVAVGHTTDDQAETILHRVLRGTGPKGLAGMTAQRTLTSGVKLIRPMLGVGRSDVQSYLAMLGQAYCTDASNADLSRTRARIRHDLLPKLAEEYNPAISRALVRLGRLTSELSRALDLQRDELKASILLEQSPNSVSLDRERLGSLPRVLRAELLRSIWRAQGWPEGAMTAARWERLACWVKRRGPRRMTVGAGIDAEMSTAGICLFVSSTRALRDTPTKTSVPLEYPGSACWANTRVILSESADEKWDERFDLDKVTLPLSVGPTQPGERFEPLGMEGRGMALGHFLRSRHVPRAERAITPVVRDAHGVIWVVGHRLAHRVRLTDATTRIGGLRSEAVQLAQ